MNKNKFSIQKKLHKNNLLKNRGFTIVETLVAVAILMISIAGPLVVATKGLMAALVSKDQMIASYLAQDTMETIKNIRDNNLATSPTPLPWDTDLGYSNGLGQCSGNTGKLCDINSIDGNSWYGCAANDPCIIYYNNSTGYTHDAGSATKTIFTRHYYFENITYTPPSSDPEVRVHVLIDWNEGTVPYQVHLTSQLVASKL